MFLNWIISLISRAKFIKFGTLVVWAPTVIVITNVSDSFLYRP